MSAERATSPGSWAVWPSLYEGMAVAIVHDVEPLRTIAEVRKHPCAFGDALLMAAAPELRAALRCAIGNLEHMAAWISAQNAGYSFECLGEDMPSMKAALAKAAGDRS